MNLESILKHRKLLYPALIAQVWLIPFLLMLVEWKGISGTLPRYWQTYEWTGYFGATILALIFVLEFLRKKPKQLTEILNLAAPFVAILPVLYQFAEYPIRSWDYDCYQIAAEKIIAGESPYFGFYFYPPLLAWCLSVLQKFFGKSEVVFFSYQFIQLILVGAMAFQIKALLSKIQSDALLRSLLLLGIMILNIPLWRTIHHNQVNLVLVNIILFTILNYGKRPLLNGLLLALGTHLKLYPTILAGIWLIRKQFKPAGYFLLFMLGTGFGLAFILPGIWNEFFSFFKNFPGGMALRDNGIHSILYNLFYVPGLNKGLDDGNFQTFIKSIYYLFAGLICLYFLYRYIARAAQREQINGNETTAQKLWLQSGDLADAGAFMVLFSPLVWEHHYVLTIPIALFAICLNNSPRNWIALFLIFVMPVADIFILSLTRISGLAILLYSLSAPVPQVFVPWIHKLRKATPALAFGLFSLFLISYISRFETRIYGDGHEYVLQTQALSTHGSTEIRKEDTKALLNHPFPVYRQDYFKDLLEFQKLEPKPQIPNGWIGFFYSNQNQLICYHFPFYSLLAVPIKWTLQALGDDWLKCFAILNIILLLLPLAYIVSYSSLSLENRIALFLFLFFGPVLWYLRWPHTEVLTTSFIALSLLCWTDKRFLTAMIWASLASLQNQPVALLIALPLFSYWQTNKKISLPLITTLFISLCLVVTPSLYYHYHFGVSNLIVSIGSASINYINSTRIFDFFFDINQGIIAGYPVILLLFIIGGFQWSRKKEFIKLFIFLIVLLGIAASAAMTINWNMGQAGISRYAVWAGIIILIPVLSEINFNKLLYIPIVAFALFCQVFILNSFGMLDVNDGSCISHNAAARWVLGSNPSLYNPEMETFQERSLGREGVLKEDVINGPLFYFRSDGKATKAIVNKNRLDTCDFFATKNALIYEKFKHLKFNSEGFAYIDLIDVDCYPHGRF